MHPNRVRDSQKQRLYDAENSVWPVRRNEFGSNDDAQKWVNDLTSSRWFRQRWRKQIRVEVGRNDGARAFGYMIRSGVDGRNPPVYLHEVAHCITWDEGAAHGAEFAATMLLLVDHVIGKDKARELRAAYVKHKVKHRWAETQREPRYEVPTQAQEREQRAAKAQVLPSLLARQKAAETLRQAVSAGHFGSAGSKSRTHALATARALEKEA
jgi:putative metallohydrolase (TIGR04338 family)